MPTLVNTQIKTVEPAVSWAQWSDAKRVYDILTSAFENDPPSRWMYPGHQQYRRFFPRFAEAFGGAAMGSGTALLSEGDSGAALWLPPGIAPDEEVFASLLEESVTDREKPDAFALFEEMGRHHPEEPHWYLPLIGVVPTAQSQGHGSTLMLCGLEQCDRDGLPAYLEATSSRSVPLYQRHGFEIVGEIRIGRCPPIFPMLRAPRKPVRSTRW